MKSFQQKASGIAATVLATVLAAAASAATPSSPLPSGLLSTYQGESTPLVGGPSHLLVGSDGATVLLDPYRSELISISPTGQIGRTRIEALGNVKEMIWSDGGVQLRTESELLLVGHGQVLQRDAVPDPGDEADLITGKTELFGAQVLDNETILVDGVTRIRIPRETTHQALVVLGRIGQQLFVRVEQAQPEGPNGALSVDQTVRVFDTTTGSSLAIGRVPIAKFVYQPLAGVTVTESGQVFYLSPLKDELTVEQLQLYPSIAPILGPTRTDMTSSGTPPTSSACSRTRSEMAAQANAFIANSTYLGPIAISGACPGRIRPRYLGVPGTYGSVSYCWGGWDLPATFNSLTSPAMGHQAGDIATNLAYQRSCASGTDCSGYVSRCWNLSFKHGTAMLGGVSTPLASDADLKRGDILLKVGDHVSLVDAVVPGGFRIWEATARNAVDRVVFWVQPLSAFMGYERKRFVGVCEEVTVPEIASATTSPGSGVPGVPFASQVSARNGDNTPLTVDVTYTNAQGVVVATKTLTYTGGTTTSGATFAGSVVLGVPGTYRITYRATSTTTGKASTLGPVTGPSVVAPSTPAFTCGASVSPTQGPAGVFTFTTCAANSDGTPLSVVGDVTSPNGSTITYTFDFVGGTTVSGATFRKAISLTMAGTYRVTYRATSTTTGKASSLGPVTGPSVVAPSTPVYSVSPAAWVCGPAGSVIRLKVDYVGGGALIFRIRKATPTCLDGGSFIAGGTIEVHEGSVGGPVVLRVGYTAGSVEVVGTLYPVFMGTKRYVAVVSGTPTFLTGAVSVTRV